MHIDKNLLLLLFLMFMSVRAMVLSNLQCRSSYTTLSQGPREIIQLQSVALEI